MMLVTDCQCQSGRGRADRVQRRQDNRRHTGHHYEPGDGVAGDCLLASTSARSCDSRWGMHSSCTTAEAATTAAIPSAPTQPSAASAAAATA
eukprot:CAMPEP_0180098320 /NCGR_PEP_ID=MMETSP0985-20121206/27689_1 /TAXON_ID=483367 /ORGANISM="non described non described, Strain CCMP 2436" /LENGTH=91 /DNA_ID=CAMNT_0022033755 /DNA_START=27 /DNA_END=298 /DNA_ORIENTATION=-